MERSQSFLPVSGSSITIRRVLVLESVSVIATTASGSAKKLSHRLAVPASVLVQTVLPVSVSAATTPSVPLSSALAK
jgi:hypothetical protein